MRFLQGGQIDRIPLAWYFVLSSLNEGLMVTIHRATNIEEAEQMKRDGKDPIVLKTGEKYILVFVKNAKLADTIWDNFFVFRWLINEGGPGDPYDKYVFESFNEERVVSYLTRLLAVAG